MKKIYTDFILLLTVIFVCATASSQKLYKLWYNKPAPFGNESYSVFASGGTTSVADDGWEKWSLPIGNGYMGACIFGRTETERIQITENSLANPSPRGLNNFSEIYLDFNHTLSSITNFTRDLNITDATAHVEYIFNNIKFTREYFTSYPDKVLAIKLKASQPGALSFTVRPTIPYIRAYGAVAGDNMGKSGTVNAVGDLITLSGKMDYYNILFEGQLKVIPSGGTMTALNDVNNDNGKIVIANADSVVILVAIGTNYAIDAGVFNQSDRTLKLSTFPAPHAKVSAIIAAATAKTYSNLLAAHKADYQKYFSRVQVDLGGVLPSVTTDVLLTNYKNGSHDKYLEELYFQYGRYLLISSSRKGALPPNLQGVWNRYDVSPWNASYTHNINTQMNYWLAFNTNLAELFESYSDYNKAFRVRAEACARTWLNAFNKSAMDPLNQNGWIMSVNTYPESIANLSPTGNTGTGVGGLTAKLFDDYYEFTRDNTILEQTAYPAVSSMSKFLAKVVKPTGGYLLANPSCSPEQMVNGTYYWTVGCAFDQQMIYEMHKNTLMMAQIRGVNESIIDTIKNQIGKLDPVKIGNTGQIKEFREENNYGDLGEYAHRHLSQLMALYPGTVVNSSTPAWMDAAKVSLTLRGLGVNGWAIAHRINAWARTGVGNTAYSEFQTLLNQMTLPNLWDYCSPFQIDGNFGGTAGVAEMLLQSHNGYIEPLPARPDSWGSGSYSGLKARGNYDVSATWNGGQATQFKILSNMGLNCKVKYFNVDQSVVTTSSGTNIIFTVEAKDIISFNTVKGETYIISSIPTYTKVTAPLNLTVKQQGANPVLLSWNMSPDAVSYNVYKAMNDSSTYTLIKSNVQATTLSFQSPDLNKVNRWTFRVTAVAANGRESAGALVYYNSTLITVPNGINDVSENRVKPLQWNSADQKMLIRSESLSEVSIVNVSGMTIWKGKFSGIGDVDLRTLTKGFYIAVWNDGRNRFSVPFVK